MGFKCPEAVAGSWVESQNSLCSNLNSIRQDRMGIVSWHTQQCEGKDICQWSGTGGYTRAGRSRRHMGMRASSGCLCLRAPQQLGEQSTTETKEANETWEGQWGTCRKLLVVYSETRSHIYKTRSALKLTLILLDNWGIYTAWILALIWALPQYWRQQRDFIIL